MTSMRDSVKRAVMWRSGSQILSQIVAWSATLIVIRILDPADYGIFAMTQVILTFLAFLGGYGFASSLIQDREVDERKIRQAFGMLLLVNGAIATVQFLGAPLAAAYYRTEMVTELLRVQALIFLSTPFIALPEVLLTREMDFKRPAICNLIATIVSASVALTCALNDFGVWTLVFAPVAAFWTRGICLMSAARFTYWPSFDLRGAGRMFNFGAAVLAGHFFWTLVTQSDIFIAGRFLTPENLGYYAEGLFLTTIVAVRFVPALNEVAFPAYAQLQDDRAALRYSFLKAVRLIMLATCPMFFGMSAVAPEMVAVLLGSKWLSMIPIVTVLAFAMPALTLHSLFAPALNAIGKPGITMQASIIGFCIVPAAFYFGVGWGGVGLAWVWVLVFPVLPLSVFLLAKPHLGISHGQMLGALAPGLGASAVMAVVVTLASANLPVESPFIRLPLLAALGAATYGGLLLLVARETLGELIRLVIKRKPPVVQPAE